MKKSKPEKIMALHATLKRPQKFNITEGINSSGDFKKFPLKKINNLRHKLYKHPELIDSFIEENPLNFSSSELKIIENLISKDWLTLSFVFCDF